MVPAGTGQYRPIITFLTVFLPPLISHGTKKCQTHNCGNRESHTIQEANGYIYILRTYLSRLKPAGTGCVTNTGRYWPLPVLGMSVREFIVEGDFAKKKERKKRPANTGRY